MAQFIFRNVSIFDGTGAAPFRGEVLVDANRIERVAREEETIDAPGAEIIDGAGGTLMPGLCEPHAHLMYTSSVDRRADRIYVAPTPEHSYITAHNGKVLLESGFTSAYSAGAMKPEIEVAFRNEVNSGYLPGPRFLAGSSEGFTSDDPDAKEPPRDAAAMRAWIQNNAKIGCNILKLLVSGVDDMWPGTEMQTMYSDETMAVAQRTIEENGMWLSCHARPLSAVKQALKHGCRVIYHCDEIDEEALDLFEARKDEVFYAPTIAVMGRLAEMQNDDPEQLKKIPNTQRYFDRIEPYRENVAKIRARGVRTMPGGDYGFPFIPTGTNARDMEYFVRHLDFTPAEALMSATKWGGEIMGLGHELGLVRGGYLADLILLEGDPLADLAIFRDREKLRYVMKEGAFYKRPAAH